MIAEQPPAQAHLAGGFGRATSVLSAVGTGWILFLMALICADVVGRDAFNTPILGVAEMVQFSIVGIVFLQLPQTLRTGGLTRSDVLLAGILKRWPRGGQVLTALFDLTGAVLFAVIFTTTLPLLTAAYQNSEFYGSTGVVQIPTWPLKALIVLGCATMTVQFLLHAWRDIRAALGQRAPAPHAGGEK